MEYLSSKGRWSYRRSWWRLWRASSCIRCKSPRVKRHRWTGNNLESCFFGSYKKMTTSTRGGDLPRGGWQGGSLQAAQRRSCLFGGAWKQTFLFFWERRFFRPFHDRWLASCSWKSSGKFRSFLHNFCSSGLSTEHLSKYTEKYDFFICLQQIQHPALAVQILYSTALQYTCQCYVGHLQLWPSPRGKALKTNCLAASSPSCDFFFSHWMEKELAGSSWSAVSSLVATV